MIKKSFFGLAKPMLEYEALTSTTLEPRNVGPGKQIILFVESPFEKQKIALVKAGDKVNTGTKIKIYNDSDHYAISSVTGVILSIASYTGDFGQSGTAITIDVSEKEEFDQQFGEVCNEVTDKIVIDYLASIPGAPCYSAFINAESKINTIVVTGTDEDLLVTTNQYVVKSNIEAVKNGINILKKVFSVANIILAVPKHLMHIAGTVDAQLKVVDEKYPSALPNMLMKDIMGQVIPAGKCSEDFGVCFLTAEAVASISTAFKNSRIPVTKTFTLMHNNKTELISARIGTPIEKVFTALNIIPKAGDRIIIGGPMRGRAVYSLDHPVEPDTDAIILQTNGNFPVVSDYPCTNCGECVRICPAKMPINEMIRLLEAGQYEEAAQTYDLYSCIECGLCSYVCVSKMPVFQYIKLAKYELARIETETAEAADE